MIGKTNVVADGGSQTISGIATSRQYLIPIPKLSEYDGFSIIPADVGAGGLHDGKVTAIYKQPGSLPMYLCFHPYYSKFMLYQFSQSTVSESGILFADGFGLHPTYHFIAWKVV